MKIGIFYLSYRAGPGRHRLTIGSEIVYIRVDVLDAKNGPLALDVALDEASPRTDESVMNSHWLFEPPVETPA